MCAFPHRPAHPRASRQTPAGGGLQACGRQRSLGPRPPRAGSAKAAGGSWLSRGYLWSGGRPVGRGSESAPVWTWQLLKRETVACCSRRARALTITRARNAGTSSRAAARTAEHVAQMKERQQRLECVFISRAVLLSLFGSASLKAKGAGMIRLVRTAVSGKASVRMRSDRWPVRWHVILRRHVQGSLQ